MRALFLTYDGAPALTADDHLAVDALAARGVLVVPRVWDAAAPLEGHVDAAVVRSCWDYHRKSGAFLEVLDELAAAGVTVLNTPSVIRWNVDKLYLREIAARGGRVPTTAWVARGDTASLEEVLRGSDLDAAVVKPRISLSALDTFRVSRRDAHLHEARFRDLVLHRDVMVQAYVPEVLAGEVSLVFLGGRFSHAVRKTPASGDFRVQSEYGARHERIEARAEWVAEAEQVLVRLGLPPLVYARIDVIEARDGLCWMELEATDPELFFQLDPEAAGRFADAVVSAIALR